MTYKGWYAIKQRNQTKPEITLRQTELKKIDYYKTQKKEMERIKTARNFK